jgi:hypothetical protein
MKSTTQNGRRTWVLLAISLALLGAVVAVRHLRPVTRPDEDAVLSALRAECGALAVPDVQETARWRERRAALGSQKWTEPTQRGLVDRIGPRWRWAEMTGDAGSRLHRLTAAAANSIPWSEIVATVAKLEATPGLTVEAIDVRTSGTRSTRSFAAVEIRVRLQWAVAGPENTVPPESVRRDRVLMRAGPLPERAAEGRARPASLRRSVRRRQAYGYRPATRRVRPDHPWLDRVNKDGVKFAATEGAGRRIANQTRGHVSEWQPARAIPSAGAGTRNTVPPESVRRDRVLTMAGSLPERVAEGRARCGRSLPSATARRLRLGIAPVSGGGLRLPSGLHSARPDHPLLVRVRREIFCDETTLN